MITNTQTKGEETAKSKKTTDGWGPAPPVPTFTLAPPEAEQEANVWQLRRLLWFQAR